MYAPQLSGNGDDGKMRIRFESVSQRLQRVHVDIVHRTPSSFYLQEQRITPDTGELGCFLLDELERLKTLDTFPAFKKLSWEISQLSQSLPELLHHKAQVVTLLTNFIVSAPAGRLNSAFCLISVLGRDMASDLQPFFGQLMDALTQVIPAVAMSGSTGTKEGLPNPELTGQLFESMSYVLKANVEHLSEHPEELANYYGPLLGNPIDFVRRLAAKAFVLVSKRLTPVIFKSHWKKVMKATSAQVMMALEGDISKLPLEGAAELLNASEGSALATQAASLPSAQRRTLGLLNGLASYLFSSFKGVKAQFHSKAPMRLRTLYGLMQSVAESVADETNPDKQRLGLFTLKTYSAVLFDVSKMLYLHVFYQNMKELIQEVTLFTESTTTLLSKLGGEKLSSHQSEVIDLLIAVTTRHVSLLLTLSGGRNFYEPSVKSEVAVGVVTSVMGLFEITQSRSVKKWIDTDTNDAVRQLFISLWLLYPAEQKLLAMVPDVVRVCAEDLTPSCGLLSLVNGLLRQLPTTVVADHLTLPLMSELTVLRTKMEPSAWLSLLTQVLYAYRDPRESLSSLMTLDSIVCSDERQRERSEKISEGLNNIVSSESFLLSNPLKDLSTAVLSQFDMEFSTPESWLVVNDTTCSGDFQSRLLLVAAANWLIDVLLTDESDDDRVKLESAVRKTMKAVIDVDLSNITSETAISTYCQFSCAVGVLFTNLNRDMLDDADTRLEFMSVVNWSLKLAQAYGESVSATYLLSYILDELAASLAESSPSDVEEPRFCVLSHILGVDGALAVMTKLAPHLMSKSFYVRLNVARILNHVRPPFEMKEGDTPADAPKIRWLDAIARIEELTRTPLDLSTERVFSRHLESLEMFVRSGDLVPAPFLSAIGGFAIGLFYAKFQTVWPLAIKLLVALGQTRIGEEALWPLLSSAIMVAQRPPSPEELVNESDLQNCFADLIVNSNPELKIESVATVASELGMFDNANSRIPVDMTLSVLFHVSYGIEIRELHVAPDSRTDAATVTLSLFNVLKQNPNVTMRHSKAIVPLFTSFLQRQFYRAFPEEPEVEALHLCGILTKEATLAAITDNEPLLSNKAQKARLESFLGIFAEITGPRQLFRCNALWALYHELVAKPDTTVARLAFDCLVTYKPAYLQPYKASIREFFNDRTLRDSLLNFQLLSPEERLLESGGISSLMDVDGEDTTVFVRSEHRPELFPLLTRILYGRLLAKGTAKRSEKLQQASRRSAIMEFLSFMPSEFLKHSLYMMVRGILPPGSRSLERLSTIAVHDEAGLAQEVINFGYERLVTRINTAVESGAAAQLFAGSNWDRLQGFLHVLKPMLSIVALGMEMYASCLDQLLVCLLSHAQSIRLAAVEQRVDAVEDAAAAEEEEVEDDEDEEIEKVDNSDVSGSKLSVVVRSLVLERYTQLVTLFHKTYDFGPSSSTLFSSISALLEALPGAVSQATKMPALLSLIVSYSTNERTLAVLASQSFVVRQLICCLSHPCAQPEVSKRLFSALHALVEHRNGDTLIPFAELVVSAFTTRFQPRGTGGKVLDSLTSELRLNDVSLSKQGSATGRAELLLLCAISEKVLLRASEHQLSPIAAGNLATLVLAFLRLHTKGRRSRLSEDAFLAALRVYKVLFWRLSDVSTHAAFFGRLFTPTDLSTTRRGLTMFTGEALSQAMLDTPLVRAELVNVYRELAKHSSVSSRLRLSSFAITQLVQYERGSLNATRDYLTAVPVFQALSNTETTPEMTRAAVAALPTMGSGADAVEESSVDALLATLTWDQLLGPSSLVEGSYKTVSEHVMTCSAVVYEVIRCAYDSDLSIRMSALTALKTLVVKTINWHMEANHGSKEVITDSWIVILTGIVMPTLRIALQYSPDSLKNGFLTVLRTVLVTAHDAGLHAYESLHLDLFPLLHTDPDQDFFENLSHLQYHRRARAFTRLRTRVMHGSGNTTAAEKDEAAMLEDEEIVDKTHSGSSNKDGITLRTTTIVHLLVPLALHYLTSAEFNKKLHAALLQESAKTLAVLVQQMPFNHYFGWFKKLLSLLSWYGEKDTPEKESLVQSTICSVVQEMPFDLDMPVRGGQHFVQVQIAEKKAIAEAATEEEAAEDEEVEEEAEVETPADDAMDVVESTPVVEDVPTVASTILRFMYPALKQRMLKKLKDHKGNDTEKVHSNIAAALASLLKRLRDSNEEGRPVVTEDKWASLFRNLVITVVNTLKSRDSDIRDVARVTLAKVVDVLGVRTLAVIFFELRSNLTEGYQRHVALYTMRSVLVSVTEGYSPPVDAPSFDLDRLVQNNSLESSDSAMQLEESVKPLVPDFDVAIPEIMMGVLADLSEELRADREADGVIRHPIREMKGSKFPELLEITSRCLLFRPTYALVNSKDQLSSIHAVSAPLLEALRSNVMDENHVLVGRVTEALQRVAQGLAKNPSVRAKELLLYLHSTLQPFVISMMGDYRRYKQAQGRITRKQKALAALSATKKQKEALEAAVDASDVSDFEDMLPSYLREEDEDDNERFACMKGGGEDKDDVATIRATTWQPAMWRGASSQRAVISRRDRENRSLHLVQDGASAPKLTGRLRHDKIRKNASSTGIEKTTLVAIRFCLVLLQTSLKKGVFGERDEETTSMVTPFLPLLRSFLHIPGASEVVSLSVKSIAQLITWGVPMDNHLSGHLAARVLHLLVRSGSLTTESELCQSCLMALVSLLKSYNQRRDEYESVSENAVLQTRPEFPLTEDRLRSLVELLTLSMTELTASYQATSFALIKEIVQSRILLPEVYDLMKRLMEQIVLSHRKGVRDSSSSLVVLFMMTYPLGNTRAAAQIDQLLSNCSYQFDEGRLSALETILNLVQKLPMDVLETHSQTFFLSMTLKLSTESTRECRELVIQILMTLAKRASNTLFSQFQDYGVRWLCSWITQIRGDAPASEPIWSLEVLRPADQVMMLIRIGAQVCSLLLKSRPETWSAKSDVVKGMLSAVHETMWALRALTITNEMINRQEAWYWNTQYHLLLLTEQLYTVAPGVTDNFLTHNYATSTSTIPVEGSGSFLEDVLDKMLFPHLWVRATATRIFLQYTQRRPPLKKRLSPYGGDSSAIEVLSQPNGLYTLSRRLCLQLNQAVLSTSLEASVVDSLVYVIRVMRAHPELDETTSVITGNATDSVELAMGEDKNVLEEIENVDVLVEQVAHTQAVVAAASLSSGSRGRATDAAVVKESQKDFMIRLRKERNEDWQERKALRDAERAENSGKSIEENVSDDESESDSEADVAEEETRSALVWTMQRLRAIGADIRGNRRTHVLRVLLSLCKFETVDLVKRFLPQVLEPPARVMLKSSAVSASDTLTAKDEALELSLREIATELLGQIENQIGAAEFMGAFAEVQQKVQRRKVQKKARAKAEAIANPAAYAQRKLAHNRSKREAQKRKNSEHAAARNGGAPKKRRVA